MHLAPGRGWCKGSTCAGWARSKTIRYRPGQHLRRALNQSIGVRVAKASREDSGRATFEQRAEAGKMPLAAAKAASVDMQGHVDVVRFSRDLALGRAERRVGEVEEAQASAKMVLSGGERAGWREHRRRVRCVKLEYDAGQG